MKITGELLKAERIKRDLSVQDIAYALKLSVRIVQAIENGQLDELPAKTFIRGFVKSYADYLKIDTDAVLKQFQEEMGSTHPVPKTSHLHQDLSEASTSSKITEGKSVFHNNSNVESLNGTQLEGGLSKKNIFYFSIVGGLVILIAVVNKITNHYQNEIPTEEQVAATEVNQPITAVSAPAIAAEGSVPALEPTSASTVSAQENTQTVSAVTIGAVSATTTPAKSPAESVAVQSPETPPKEKSNGQPVEILIEAKKDFYIEYAKGNTAEFKRINLKANTYQILKSASGLHLRTSDGSAFNITVNGINKGSMSSANKSVEMTF